MFHERLPIPFLVSRAGFIEMEMHSIERCSELVTSIGLVGFATVEG